MSLPFSIGIIVLLFLSLLPTKLLNILNSICSGLVLIVYIQIMFFNQFIGQINGGSYYWREHQLHTFINLIFWIFVITLTIFLYFKSPRTQKIVSFAKIVVFLLLFISLSYTLIVSSKDSFQRRQFYIDAKERFTVGKEENIIILVMDAVDNEFIKTILANNPDYFDNFNDFTLYTNTCSVYDMTELSVPNMLFGYRGTSESYNDYPFANKLRYNGFRILCFSVYGMRYGCVDNYISTDNIKETLSVQYNQIQSGFISLSAYCICPCIVKSSIKTNKINFAHCVLYGSSLNDISYANEDFYLNLNLRYNSQSDKLFIYEHLDGAHYYCEDYIAETEYCLEIYNKYINQIKELGVYDNSTIIFCSDHGIHDGIDPNVPFPYPATPMFMIKQKREKHEKMQISNAPLYYTDFQSTVLRASGLFDAKTDYDIFGKSIYDYSENSVRKRTWFETPWDGGKYRKYTYYGNTEDLENSVKTNSYKESNSTSLDNSDFN